MVKRLIARWHNRQYVKQLEREMQELAGEIDKAAASGNDQLANELTDRWADDKEVLSRVSADGEGKKTLHPGEIDDDANLRKLITNVSSPATPSPSASCGAICRADSRSTWRKRGFPTTRPRSWARKGRSNCGRRRPG